MYALYAIPGSHACRSAMLMLEHKHQPYRRVELVTLLHPIGARLRGLDSGDQERTIGGKRPAGLRLADRLGTVPGLAWEDQRISTNHDIARFLEHRHPEPPLLPADPAERHAVEEVERWANDTLQMDARRIVARALVRDVRDFSRQAAAGRLGCLLYRRARVRRLVFPLLGRFVFPPSSALERELPATLDRIDTWIADGVLGGSQPNVADFMVAPSLALILYRSDVLPLFEGRPALELVDRLLPEPASYGAVEGRATQDVAA
jgi:glutathione S-transferase